MANYMYSQWNYSAGAQTVAVENAGKYLAEIWNCNCENSNKTLTANITTTGNIIAEQTHTSNANQSDLDKRNLIYKAALLTLSVGDTVTFDCSGSQTGYVGQVFTLISLNADDDITVNYFRSGIDNTNIHNPDTLSLAGLNPGRYLVQFLEIKQGSGANATLSISSPAGFVNLAFDPTGTSNGRIAASIGNTDTVITAVSSNSGGSSYASKIYTVLEIDVTPSFTVDFNSSGGEGTMTPQNIPIDTPTALNLNTFTKLGYLFSGWSTVPGGTVVYQDGEIVENLVEAGESITLYAVWVSSGYLDIAIQQNTSDSIKLDKNITTLLTLQGTLKTPVSIIDPVILIQANLLDLVNANYMTIPLFGRKYFIHNITSVKNGLVEISAHVDVLETYKTQIRANRGIISRAESRNVFNLLLNDGSLKSYQDPYILTEPFPAGFTGQAFVLAVAGG